MYVSVYNIFSSSHFLQLNCLLILRSFCNCAQCDYGLFSGGVIVIVNCIYIILLVAVLTLLSCYVIMILRFCSTVVFVSFLCKSCLLMLLCSYNYAPCDAGFYKVVSSTGIQSELFESHHACRTASKRALIATFV